MRKSILALVASAALLGPTMARADVTGSLGHDAALPITAMTTAGLAGGAMATLTGGTVYSAHHPSFAAMPYGTVGSFLAAGSSSGTSAVLTFGPPVSYLSFLWGSPDTYNLLSVTSTAGTFWFTTASMSFSVQNGDQGFGQYVQFETTGAGERILSVNLLSNTNAFEASNFRVAALPTPAPVAGAGLPVLLGLAGGWLIRRKRAPAA